MLCYVMLCALYIYVYIYMYIYIYIKTTFEFAIGKSLDQLVIRARPHFGRRADVDGQHIVADGRPVPGKKHLCCMGFREKPKEN